MVKSLEIGKTYRWIGPQDYNDNWAGEMDKIKDGKPRKVLRNNFMGRLYFEGFESSWHWDHVLEHFEEVIPTKQLFLDFED